MGDIVSDYEQVSFTLEEYHDKKLEGLAGSRGSSKSEELRRILDMYFDSSSHVEDEIKEKINKLDDRIEEKREELNDEIQQLEEERSMFMNRLEELQNSNEDNDDVDVGGDVYSEAISTLVDDFVEGRLSSDNLDGFPPLRHWADRLGLSREELFSRVKAEAEE